MPSGWRVGTLSLTSTTCISTVLVADSLGVPPSAASKINLLKISHNMSLCQYLPGIKCLYISMGCILAMFLLTEGISSYGERGKEFIPSHCKLPSPQEHGFRGGGIQETERPRKGKGRNALS